MEDAYQCSFCATKLMIVLAMMMKTNNYVVYLKIKINLTFINISLKTSGKCGKSFFQCKGVNGKCVPEEKMCDGKFDCREGEDEDECCMVLKRLSQLETLIYHKPIQKSFFV